MMDDAKLITDPAEKAKAWGEIDKRLTGLAPAVSWVWDKNVELRSANVNGVVDEDTGLWSIAYSSIK
jgi:hypothetical protein